MLMGWFPSSGYSLIRLLVSNNTEPLRMNESLMYLVSNNTTWRVVKRPDFMNELMVMILMKRPKASNETTNGQ